VDADGKGQIVAKDRECRALLVEQCLAAAGFPLFCGCFPLRAKGDFAVVDAFE
jgi:hypothetical protein